MWLFFLVFKDYTHTQPQVAKKVKQSWLQNVLICFIIVLKKKGVTIMSISEKIYALRTKSGVNQEAFAEKLSVSRQSVQKWESGVKYIVI